MVPGNLKNFMHPSVVAKWFIVSYLYGTALGQISL